MNMEQNRRSGAAAKIAEWVYSAADVVISALICVVLIYTLVFATVRVDGVSMLPTLEDGERVVVSHIGCVPENGDVVVMTDPNGKIPPLVKRVIAVAGQEIDINFETGEVRVDGILLDEPYIREKTTMSSDMEFPQMVPDGHVFLMGDNRNHSKDSRNTSIGMVDARWIAGKVYYRFLPVSKAGVVS